MGQLIFAPAFAADLRASLPALRRVVAAAALGGHPVPGALGGAGLRGHASRRGGGRRTSIQGQRDYFGRHGFVRLDTGAVHQHGPWAD